MSFSLYFLLLFTFLAATFLTAFVVAAGGWAGVVGRRTLLALRWALRLALQSALWLSAGSALRHVALLERAGVERR